MSKKREKKIYICIVCIVWKGKIKHDMLQGRLWLAASQWLGPSFICRLWQGFRCWIDTGLYCMEYSKVRSSYFIKVLSQVDKLYYIDVFVFLYFLKSPSQAFFSMATSHCFTVFNYRACCRMGKPWNVHGVTSSSRKKMDVTGSAAWCAKQKSVGSLNKLAGAQM